jgi:hypothetical protein
MFLDGYKHYISATIVLILSLYALMDPTAVMAVSTFFASIGLPISVGDLGLAFTVLLVLLKKLQVWSDTPVTNS